MVRLIRISFGFLMLVSIFALLLTARKSTVRASTPGSWVPIGASYQAATLDRFAEVAVTADSDGVVVIRVLPITYASDPFSISAEERAENFDLASARTGQVQDACEYVVSGLSGLSCDVQLVDIQLRDDALHGDYSALLNSDVDGVFILGGDQTIAMQVVANTPVEATLKSLHDSGAVIGGTSAGAAVQSRYMIAGYTGDNYAWHGLQFGAIDLWYGPDSITERGLQFGLATAVIDQHVLERGRIPRLLQAVQQKPGQHVGLGVDWGTGVVVENDHLVSSTAGWYAGIVIDEETNNSAQSARYVGRNRTLSIQDVFLHILPEGEFGYDLHTRLPIINGVPETAVPDVSSREFAFLSPDAGAGLLFLTGELSEDNPKNAITQRFARLARQTRQPTLVLAAGFVDEADAAAAAELWARNLRNLRVRQVETAVLTPHTDFHALANQIASAGAIFITGNDQTAMAAQVANLQAAGLDKLLRAQWHAGAVLLLDNAAAAAAGEWMSNEPTPGSDFEIIASDSFLEGYVQIAPGLSLVPGAVFEPRFMYDYLYGRLVSHVFSHSDVVAFGLQRETALIISSRRVQVSGSGVVMALDGRFAGTLDVGTNDVMAATWLILDTYAPGEKLPLRQE